MPDVRPLELRLAPEFRRCAVYVAVAAGVVVGMLVWTKLSGLNPQPWPTIGFGGGVIAAGTTALLAIAFRYHLRIDARGVWRRRLVRWNLWPWEAFEGGRVRHGAYGDQVTYPEAGWYWRTISASVLGEADRAAFERVVGRYRVPPPPPELPDAITVRVGRQMLELSAAGVRVSADRHDPGPPVPWSDVARAEVVRATHDRPDFSTFDLRLSGRADPPQLIRRRGQSNWTGADAEVIVAFVRRHLAAGRFEVTALRGPPADAAEADRRLARLDRGEEHCRSFFRYFGGVCAASVVILAGVRFAPWNRPNPLNWGPRDWAAAGLAVGLSVLMIGGVSAGGFGFVLRDRRDIRRQRDELTRWKAAHAPAA